MNQLDMLKNLYPHLSEAKLEQAQTNVRAFLAVLIRMAERLSSEDKSINNIVDEGDLDAPGEALYDTETKVES